MAERSAVGSLCSDRGEFGHNLRFPDSLVQPIQTAPPLLTDQLISAWMHGCPKCQYGFFLASGKAVKHGKQAAAERLYGKKICLTGRLGLQSPSLFVRSHNPGAHHAIEYLDPLFAVLPNLWPTRRSSCDFTWSYRCVSALYRTIRGNHIQSSPDVRRTAQPDGPRGSSS